MFFHSQKNKTVHFLITIASKKIDRFDAEILLGFILKKSREFLLTYPEYTVSWWQKQRFRSAVKKRAKNIPLAYITGHKEFFGLDFFVNKYTLVPRPDTEILVEAVLSDFEKITSLKLPQTSLIIPTKVEESQITIIDIGTGSGCIPIALAKNIKNKNTKIFATDISKFALKTARKNAKKYNANITFLHGSLFTPFLKNPSLISGTQILLSANLPYLTQEQFDSEFSIQHEPYSALVAEDKGLALYKELLREIKDFITNKKIEITCFFEIDPSQGIALSQYILQIFENPKIEIIKDLAGSERTLKIKIL